MTQSAPALADPVEQAARAHAHAVKYCLEELGAGLLMIEVWHPDGRRADVSCLLEADDLNPDTFTARYLEIAGQAIVGQLRKWADEGVAARVS